MTWTAVYIHIYICNHVLLFYAAGLSFNVGMFLLNVFSSYTAFKSFRFFYLNEYCVISQCSYIVKFCLIWCADAVYPMGNCGLWIVILTNRQACQLCARYANQCLFTAEHIWIYSNGEAFLWVKPCFLVRGTIHQKWARLCSCISVVSCNVIRSQWLVVVVLVH